MKCSAATKLIQCFRRPEFLSSYAVQAVRLVQAAILVTHLAGAERYWIGDVAGEEPSGRLRDTEFRTQGVEVEALESLLARTLDHSRGVLKRLTLEDLSSPRISSRDGKSFTVAWCLAHALEHTALHLGHIQITRQLWDIKAGF